MEARDIIVGGIILSFMLFMMVYVMSIYNRELKASSEREKELVDRLVDAHMSRLEKEVVDKWNKEHLDNTIKK